MQTVISQDGTTIAYDRRGEGPPLILVDGATATRQAPAPLAQLLAPHFTVYAYDRRGRGDSSDTPPYAVAKEVADIAALVQAAGGSASLFGMSSGGALAIEAAIALGRSIEQLAVYEVPYDSSEAGVAAWRQFRPQLAKRLTARDNEGALTLFMQFVGTPDEALEALRKSPQWNAMAAIAPTLAYDVAVVGDDRVVPAARAARIQAPTLLMDGGASRDKMPFMQASADELARAIPHAQRRTLEGQAHAADPKALAAALESFLTSARAHG
jgi:pimeloyl-ACP methyl ester carboxylesterase